MAVFEQDQAALVDLVGCDPRGLGARIVRGHREQKQILEQGDGIDIGLADRQREQRGIQRAALDLLDQLPGLGFPQFELQIGEPALQQRENPRQQIGRQ